MAETAKHAGTLKTFDFPRFDGGINLRDSEFQLPAGESPDMLNLWWQDGCLQSRPGQEWISAVPTGFQDSVTDDTDSTDNSENGGADSTTGGADAAEGTGSINDTTNAADSTNGIANAAVGYAACEEAFHNRIFLHIGTKLYLLDFDSGITDENGLIIPAEKYDGLPPSAGTFFRFGECLYYKTVGAFVKIAYNSAIDDFTLSDVAEEAFIPTVIQNASPADGTGEGAQPVNRLSPLRRISYRPEYETETVACTGDGIHNLFSVYPAPEEDETAGNSDVIADEYGINEGTPLRGIKSVHVGKTLLDPALYRADLDTGTVKIYETPAEGSAVIITVELGRTVYRLPGWDVSGVESVSVDGVQTSGYRVNLSDCRVVFDTAPGAEAVVEIVYRVENDSDFQAVMNCPCAAVYGAGERMCIVTGGGGENPGSLYWSGVRDGIADASYWPVSNTLTGGADAERVTGFGAQYDQLIVFREHSTGKLTAGNTTGLDGEIPLVWRGVNHRIGCDLPGSICLVGNNLVFCTSESGVYMIRSTSAAYENNLVALSGKINGSGLLDGDTRPGLLHDLRTAGTGPVSAMNDGSRYWLCVNGHAWVWDFTLSDTSKPVWFCFTNLEPVSWFRHNGKIYHLNRSGRVTRLGQCFHDYGEGIAKTYQFPVQNFGSYERLKDITDIFLALRADMPGEISLRYDTDYESRTDAVSMHIRGWDRLSERDLSYRDLSVPKYAAVFHRQPKCHHVRHFSLRLENTVPGENLALLRAQMQIRFQERER